MADISSPAPESLKSAGWVKDHYGVSLVCLWKWQRHPTLNFPKPLYIRNRRYWRWSDLLAFEAAQLTKGRVAA